MLYVVTNTVLLSMLTIFNLWLYHRVYYRPDLLSDLWSILNDYDSKMFLITRGDITASDRTTSRHRYDINILSIDTINYL